MALSIIDQSSRNMHHIKAEYFLFHIVYVTQLFFLVRYDSYCNVSTHIMNHIGLYRDVWIAAIASSTTSLATRTAAICVRFQGRRVRRVYVTMQITFLTRKSALIYRRQRVASLTLNCNGDFAIRAYNKNG